MTHEEPLLMMKLCREFSRLGGGTREVNREAAKAWRNRRQAGKNFFLCRLSHSISAPEKVRETLGTGHTSPAVESETPPPVSAPAQKTQQEGWKMRSLRNIHIAICAAVLCAALGPNVKSSRRIRGTEQPW